jgi:hypothetical protein
MRKKGNTYSHDSHYAMRLVSLSLEIDYRHHKFLSTITTIAKVKHCSLVYNKIIKVGSEDFHTFVVDAQSKESYI